MILSFTEKEQSKNGMKEYTFETPNGFFEYYDIRKARKKALEIAKEINDEVLVTCMHKPSYKQDWFTAHPNGNWTIDMKGFSADN
jgi:D-tyrosyl-tRNA(Tyr) deacylase